jgi:hypothetical protein
MPIFIAKTKSMGKYINYYNLLSAVVSAYFAPGDSLARSTPIGNLSEI